MSKISKAIFLFSAVAMIAFVAAKASWNDVATISDSNFTTGKLDITTDPTTALFNVAAAFPGWSQTREVTVTNSGTVAFNYVIADEKISGDDILWQSSALHLKIGTTDGGSDVYDGTLKDLTMGSPRTLAATESETLYLTLSLDNSAPNTLQEKTLAVAFHFNATQP